MTMQKSNVPDLLGHPNESTEFSQKALMVCSACKKMVIATLLSTVLIQYCCVHAGLTNDANGILHLHYFKMFLFWSYLCTVFCTKFLNFLPVSHYFQIVFQVLIVQILVWFKFTQGHLRKKNNFLRYIFHHSGITTNHTPAKEAKMARALNRVSKAWGRNHSPVNMIQEPAFFPIQAEYMYLQLFLTF